MSRTRLGLWLCLLLGVLIPLPSVVSAPAGPRRIAFIVDSWYPRSHADVIGSRFLNGYRLEGTFFPSPLTVASVFATAPRPNDQTRVVAGRYGFRVANSVAEALLAGSEGERLAVDGIVIATRVDLPEEGQERSPTSRLLLIREVFRILDQTGARVPIFIDKMLAANWWDSQTIVAEAKRRGIPLMVGSVLPHIPFDLPVRQSPAEVVVVVASTPYWAFAFHAAEFLQRFMEQRGPRETGIRTIREVGLSYWSLSERDRWGGRVLDALLDSARTRRARAPAVPAGLGPETRVVLIQYMDGARAVLALIPRVFGDSEFLLGAQLLDGSISTGGLVLRGEPFDHFGYLVHALVEFFTFGRAPIPAERTLLTTGIVFFGQQARQLGGPVADASLAITYLTAPRRP